MCELGASGDGQKLNRLWQLQQRRRGEQEIARQREDGAERTVGGLPIGVVTGRLLRGFRLCHWRGERRRNGVVYIGQAGLSSRRGSCDLSVEMPEGQRKLDRERKQRQPRAVLEVLPEPVHEAYALSPTSPIRAADVTL